MRLFPSSDVCVFIAYTWALTKISSIWELCLSGSSQGSKSYLLAIHPKYIWIYCFPLSATCLAHLTHVYLNTLTILGEECKLWSSCHSFHHTSVTSSFLKLNIFLGTFFLAPLICIFPDSENTVMWCIYILLEIKFSKFLKTEVG